MSSRTEHRLQAACVGAAALDVLALMPDVYFFGLTIAAIVFFACGVAIITFMAACIAIQLWTDG